MTETIYARVPDQVKAAAEDFAATNGLTLAAAIATLMDRGLQANADEASVAKLQEQSAKLRAEVKSLREREQAASSASQALSQRIGSRSAPVRNARLRSVVTTYSSPVGVRILTAQ